METLDKNLLMLTALDLDLPSLLSLCRSNKRFNELICENDTFWRNKLVRLGMKNIDEIPNPKEAVKQINNEKGMIYASADGDIYRVKYLVEHGANIYAIDAGLRAASSRGQLDIVKYLVEHKADKNGAIPFASLNGQLDVVKYLVEHNANIHVDNDGALRYASLNGDTEMINYITSIY